jgi:uncharacterized NAD(P)/FAD-binding protein YdhS
VELALPRGLGALVRAVRSGAAAADHWSATVDAVRPDTQLLWTGLPSREQERFLRHVAPYWNVHRHRLPPATAAAFRALVEGGGLELLAGRIESARPVGNGIGVDLVLRQTQEVRQTTVTHVVNCMGPALLADETPALVRSLVARGLTRLDVHGIGLDTGADGRLLDRDGRGAASLFALGALRRGTLWESTAIPEIRDQAAAFARMVAHRAAVHAA